jgi:hypothetical protein
MLKSINPYIYIYINNVKQRYQKKKIRQKKMSTLINFSNHESRYHIGSTIHEKNHQV